MGVTNATDVLIDNITLHTASTSNLPPKNTDALDVSRSSNIVFQNSKLTVGDDCLAINEGKSRKGMPFDITHLPFRGYQYHFI